MKIRWRRDRLPTPVFLGFPGGSAGKESACSAGNRGSIPGLGRSSGERNSSPLQYSGLENSKDCRAHGVTKSRWDFCPPPTPCWDDGRADFIQECSNAKNIEKFWNHVLMSS